MRTFDITVASGGGYRPVRPVRAVRALLVLAVL